MRSIALLLLLLGIVLITIGYTKMKIKCPPPRIEYRFVPQTFIDEQLNSTNVSSNLNDILDGQDPWFGEDVKKTASTRTDPGDNFYQSKSSY